MGKLQVSLRPEAGPIKLVGNLLGGELFVFEGVLHYKAYLKTADECCLPAIVDMATGRGIAMGALGFPCGETVELATGVLEAHMGR